MNFSNEALLIKIRPHFARDVFFDTTPFRHHRRIVQTLTFAKAAASLRLSHSSESTGSVRFD